MTVFSKARKISGMAMGLCLMAALAACAGHHRDSGEDGKPIVPKVVAPSTEQELKHLPKGLLPDTSAVSHSGEEAPAQ